MKKHRRRLNTRDNVSFCTCTPPQKRNYARGADGKSTSRPQMRKLAAYITSSSLRDDSGANVGPRRTYTRLPKSGARAAACPGPRDGSNGPFGRCTNNTSSARNVIIERERAKASEGERERERERKLAREK